jgi:monothiol glutaredoxin
MSESTNQKIEELVQSSPIVLFMKGNKNFPQCGFSATVVQILSGLVDNYQTVNVLSDPDIRQGIKDYSQWPTIPQLYINGEFVGGCDIVRELFASGDLQKQLGIDPSSLAPPNITISDTARDTLKGALAESPDGDVVHMRVDARFRVDLTIGPANASDLVSTSNGMEIHFDVGSIKRAEGIVIDYQKSTMGEGFKIDNPNAPGEIKQLAPKDLKSKLDAGEIVELFDVRPDSERSIALLEGSKVLDDDGMKYAEELDRETPLAFYCHHGRRSLNAAEHFRQLGFKNLYNLAGGIDAWSQEVDGDIPRY